MRRAEYSNTRMYVPCPEATVPRKRSSSRPICGSSDGRVGFVAEPSTFIYQFYSVVLSTVHRI